MTTNELHELAKDPQAFDTELAELHTQVARAQARKDRAMDRIHSGAADRKSYVNRSVMAWRRTHAEVIDEAKCMAELDVRGRGNINMGHELTELDLAQTELAGLFLSIQAMDAVYAEYRWTRFFPSVTKSQPHIHRSLTCHTLFETTVMTWAPGLSGKTDEQAVAELDEALCTVCFPTAPVALREYVSKRSQDELARRQAEKHARDAKRAAKTLTEAEQFRTEHGNDRITTVAACKELIRKAIEQEVTLDYYDSPAATASWTAGADSLARVRSNVAGGLAEMCRDSQRAMAVLIDREAEHEGWGSTAEAIDKMMASKRKSARKEWGL